MFLTSETGNQRSSATGPTQSEPVRVHMYSTHPDPLCVHTDASSKPESGSGPALFPLCGQRGVHHSPPRHREELGLSIRADVLECHAAERVSRVSPHSLVVWRKTALSVTAWSSRWNDFNKERNNKGHVLQSVETLHDLC